MTESSGDLLPFQPESQSDIQEMIFQREKRSIETTRINPDFESVRAEIEAFIQTGELNNITILPPEEQNITSEMSVARSIKIVHSNMPEMVFVVGGIGQVSSDENRVLHVDNMNRDKTVHSLPGVTGFAQQTFLVAKDGTYGYEVPNDPLGGYWQHSAEKKYDNTVQARALLQGKALQSVIPVLAGGYTEPESEKMGFFVYALPLRAKPSSSIFLENFKQLAAIDSKIQDEGRKEYPGKRVYIISHPQELTELLENGPYLQMLRVAAEGIRDVSDKNYLHRQLHMGQLHGVFDENGDIKEVYLGDWHTLQSLHDYPTEISDKLGRSPRAEAKWQEIRHFVMNALNFSLPNNLDGRSILTRLKPVVLFQMMAYYAYRDRTIIPEKIQEWKQEYGLLLFDLYSSLKATDKSERDRVDIQELHEQFLESLLRIPDLFQ